jgi:hypothetical protein
VNAFLGEMGSFNASGAGLGLDRVARISGIGHSAHFGVLYPGYRDYAAER